MDSTSKNDGVSYATELEMTEQQAGHVTEAKSTSEDQHAMWRMGKVQEMQRNFRFVSIFGFSMILMASWETMLGYGPNSV